MEESLLEKLSDSSGLASGSTSERSRRQSPRHLRSAPAKGALPEPEPTLSVIDWLLMNLQHACAEIKARGVGIQLSEVLVNDEAPGLQIVLVGVRYDPQRNRFVEAAPASATLATTRE